MQWAFEHEDMAMSTRKTSADKKPTTVVANDPDDPKGTLTRIGGSPSKKPAADKNPKNLVINDPAYLKGRLKHVGGSQSDHWNNILAIQTAQTLWIKHSDEEFRHQQYEAAMAGLIGIEPQDELEGMMAAQLIAAHNAAMECHRRAMIGEQTVDGRRENLSQANKLSRTYAVLLEALNRHRGKGQQKVTVEHIHVHSGGQAIVGVVENSERGSQRKSEDACDAQQIAHAPQPTVWSADQARDPLPGTSDAERPVPYARRNVARSTEGK
jgi:hypothetical protein